MASNGVVNNVAEAPPSGAAMHCKQSRGTQTGHIPLSMPATRTTKTWLWLLWLPSSFPGVLETSLRRVTHYAFGYLSKTSSLINIKFTFLFAKSWSSCVNNILVGESSLDI